MWPSREVAEALPSGTGLGRYECVRRIAVGGMAELYLGRAVGPGGFEKLVVIKRVLPHRTTDDDFVNLFVKEARIAASLDHANVVKVMDFGVADGDYYLVMEYLHGHDLLDVCRKHRGPLPWDVALSVVVAAARGLHYVHERTGPDGRPLGLVHRDVSPSNVFVCRSGEVKVVDFGIAKATEATLGTRSGGLKGKIPYMSPEHGRGGPVDRRSDVHALGNVLYGLTTGRRMYSGASEFGVLNRVVEGRFALPHEVRPDYPAQLEAILLRAVAYDPADRWPTAKDLAEALEHHAYEIGLRTGPSVIEGFMDRTFGPEPFPSLGPPSSTSRSATAESASFEEAETAVDPSRRRRGSLRTRLTVTAALGVGAALGLWVRSGEPAPAGPAPREAAAPAATDAGLRASAEPVSVASPAAAGESTGADEASAPSEGAATDGADEMEGVDEMNEVNGVDQSARPTERRPPKRRRTKRSATSAASQPDHSSLFMPPSKRGE
ncbi:MAG: serine/threonine protein kinase [Myxococcales bacterium]|nr:serine/threonine protein kinase [Myxococcales bacterium]